MSKRFLALVMLLALCALLPLCVAKDLGTLGPVYPIVEENFLSFIKKRAASLNLVALQEQLQKTAMRYRDRPSALALPRAVKTKTRLFDPSIVLREALVTDTGLELVPKGTRINPLSTHRLSKALLFLNADDKAQVAWARALDRRLIGKDKVILVDGSLLEAEKAFKKAVYFDQAGRITTHFGIQHVPAWVSQEKQRLRITEVAL